MPRRRRHDQISEYHLQEIERQADRLRSAMDAATLSLTPSQPHYDIIHELSRALHRAMNLLNNRPADYEKPHRSLFG